MTDHDAIKKQARAVLLSVPDRPDLIVFDLDYTLWGTWCECHARGRPLRVYTEVPAILDAIGEVGIRMAVASRSPTPDIAESWLHALHWTHRFVSRHIYASLLNKTEHLDRICRDVGVSLDRVLFFDDEPRNIEDVRSLGVTSIEVENGVTVNVLEEGLRLFQR